MSDVALHGAIYVILGYYHYYATSYAYYLPVHACVYYKHDSPSIVKLVGEISCICTFIYCFCKYMYWDIYNRV